MARKRLLHGRRSRGSARQAGGVRAQTRAHVGTGMRLLITDPVTIALDAADVVSLRAEDASGSFGILAGHADFLTTLAISVVSWRHADGRAGYCAVRGGILTVS